MKKIALLVAEKYVDATHNINEFEDATDKQKIENLSDSFANCYTTSLNYLLDSYENKDVIFVPALNLDLK